MAKQTKKIQKNMKENATWEQKWKNGKELIMRVTKRLSETEERVRTLEAINRSSNAVIGALVTQSNEDVLDWMPTNKTMVTKAMVKEIIEKYKVTATETEDKLGFIIEVTEVKADGVANESNDNSHEVQESESIN